jgi:hypothetical protein
MNEGTIMDNYLIIWALKERIKGLAELQSKSKRARKTTLDKAEWLLLKNELAPKKAYWDHNAAASDARLRKAEITVCLNYYHELRGSALRHGNAETLKGYWYGKYMTELKADLAKIKN